MNSLSAQKRVKPDANSSETDAGALELVTDELCLNFANTVGNHRSIRPDEHLGSFADLVEWSRHAGGLSDRTAARLLQASADRQDEARRVLQRAISLREAIYRIFSAASVGAAPRQADLKLLNRVLSTAMARGRLVQSTGEFAWDWAREDDSLDQMLWPIARSAAGLLTSGNLKRVAECANDDCGWLFVDVSKNHSRRWCSMSDCGNRVKARRHYARVRKQT